MKIKELIERLQDIESKNPEAEVGLFDGLRDDSFSCCKNFRVCDMDDFVTLITPNDERKLMLAFILYGSKDEEFLGYLKEKLEEM